MVRSGFFLAVLICGCAEPKPVPNVIEPAAGETLTSIPGPLPHFGPFDSVEDAIFAACPAIMNLPHAVIPVPRGDQNFKLYWGLSREYCAWLYAPESQRIEMSLFAVSAVQDDPKRRKCRLPPQVTDSRYPSGSIGYLAVLHGHPVDEILSRDDARFLASMAELHGYTSLVKGVPVPISVVAFVARERDGKVACTGFYQYIPALSDEVVKVSLDDRSGRWGRRVAGHVARNEYGEYEIKP